MIPVTLARLFRKNSHLMDKYFVLISGPFANLSSDLNPLVDFIAREQGTVSANDGVPRFHTWRYSLNAEAHLD